MHTMKPLMSLVGCVCAAGLLSACGNTTPTATPSTSVSSTTSQAAAATSDEPSTTAPQPPLTPFVGTWQKHQETLVIDATGTGNWKYADLRACPSCSSAEAPAATLAFTLTAVTNGMASGAVTASSDEQNGAAGDQVTAKIVPGYEGKGVNLVMTIDNVTERVMCNNTSAGQCGA